jgi:hypothetical protein
MKAGIRHFVANPKGLVGTKCLGPISPLLLIAAWLPVTHLVLHALGRKTTLQPDTVGSILMVGVVVLFATLIGGFVGAAVGGSAFPRKGLVERYILAVDKPEGGLLKY